MIFTEGDKKTFLPAYAKIYDPKKAYTLGNRSIGLMFGQRVRPTMLWEMRTTVKEEVVLVDEYGVDNVLGTVKDIRSLSFTFDPFSYPIVAVEVLKDGKKYVEVYRFNNYGGDEVDKVKLLTLENCRCPKLVPSNISDQGSILNQPILFYIDPQGNILKRTLRTNFTVVDGLPIKTGLLSTDELKNVGITNTGQIQLELSKLK